MAKGLKERREKMSEATREYVIEKSRQVLQAYTDRIKSAENYIDYFPIEGQTLINNYSNNIDNQKELLEDFLINDDFFENISDDQLILLMNKCRELNKLYELNVKDVSEISKIERREISKLDYSEKIRRAIEYSSVIDEILEEIGDIKILVTQMVVVSGVMIALAATGYGAAVEALGFVLLTVGATFSGSELLKGIIGLAKFFTAVTDVETEEDLKRCGKLFGDSVAKIGVDGFFFVLSMFGLKKSSIQLTTKKIVDNGLNSKKWAGKKIKSRKLDIEKMTPEGILNEAGYKEKGIIKNIEYKKQIQQLQRVLSDEELINSLSRMKKKGIKNSLEHLTKINDILEKINIPYKGIAIENAEEIRNLKKYYTQQELVDILNQVKAEDFEPTVKKLTQIQKELLSKEISSSDTNKFAREFITELELNHGISEKRLNTLRNLDYNKMTAEDYQKLKPEIDAITNLTKSYDLNKVKPGKMRKYIPIEDVEKYISGKYDNRLYEGIRGFITRQEDVLHLKSFDDIFYTMRLDYEGNTFIYNREIAYIDFVADSYEDTFVPIGELYGGTENWSSPFGGMGLLKTENGQLIREYVSRGKELKFSNMNEAEMYKINKKGKVELIAEFNGKRWIRK